MQKVDRSLEPGADPLIPVRLWKRFTPAGDFGLFYSVPAKMFEKRSTLRMRGGRVPEELSRQLPHPRLRKD